MLSKAEMTRRLLLRGVGAICLAAVAKPGLAAVSTPLDRRREVRVAVDLVRAALPNHRSAARVGAAYLRTVREEFDVEGILKALTLQAPELTGVIGAPEPESVKAAVRRQVVMDFESDTVVQVDGWILSRTEVRLAALAHMVRDNLAIA